MPGRYVALDFPWYETRILNCSFCGKMIAGEYWQDSAFPSDKFCEPSCAEVKQRLKGPRRHAKRPSPKTKHA